MTSDKQHRGFASMDPERQKAIASLGGLASQASGRAHRFTSEEGREAGHLGGTKISQDSAYMSMIGRKGGLSRQHGKKETVECVPQSQTPEMG